MRNTNKTHRDIQLEITNKVITAIENGKADGKWQMPWQAAAKSGWPVNAVTSLPYHGVNVIVLSLTSEEFGWPNKWASFNQWKERGASVKKGEHGTQIVFYSPIEIPNTTGEDEPEDTRIIPLLRYATVFNVAQVDNPPAEQNKPIPSLVERIEQAEKFISRTGADIRYGGNQAFFRPVQDFIRIPDQSSFTGSETSSATEAFYATHLHELCHWTGAETRLNRVFGKRFGDDAYAAEELVAEIGAAFACAMLGISAELRPDHVQYVASWLKILKGDKRAIFTASSAATKAIDLLSSLQGRETSSEKISQKRG